MSTPTNLPEKSTAEGSSSPSVTDSKLSLDALLSPPPQESFIPHVDETPPETATEPAFKDVGLDDEERFSTVPLTARQSQASVASNGSQSPKSTSNEVEVESSRKAVVSMAASDSSTLALHRRSISPSRDRDSITGNAPFILARVEKEQNEVGTPGKRVSVDGQLKLQEEFVRIQHDIKEEDETQAAAAALTIDWDYQLYASENPEKLARAIELGIPSTLRGMMWSAAKDPELEATYLSLLKEVSPHEKAIIRDLGRTFPHHEYFTDGEGIGQENLFNVLKAYSIYDPEVGYCQGLPFIVAILLLNMPDEEAFSLLVRLMYSYDVRGHFLPEMPKLLLRLVSGHLVLAVDPSKLSLVSEELLPVLNIHFLRQGVKSSMFCSQWFLTLFPLDIAFRIYDNCLASGIEAIFGFSIVLLKKNEDELLKLKFDEILAFMKTRVFEKYKIERPEEEQLPGQKESYRVDEFVQDAVSLRITPFMLDSYAHEYEEMVRRREAHAAELDALRTSNRNLLSQNELVKARLNTEETEAELVRYKLLYAEAMHKNDEARSSQSRISGASLLSSGASLFSRRS
ncbi:hypothetical protein HWV62_14364 [Athelia sp. TMB]|nr:hypothetical protein HWV62_14364 [Athelia sp. TMB]